MVKDVKQVYPCGECYCGCGARLEDPTKYFLAGHDKRGQGKVIAAEYGSVAAFLVHHGYGPKSRPRKGS